MPTEFFIGSKPIFNGPYNSQTNRTVNVSVFRLWKLIHSDACLCGNKKVFKFTRKSGWSSESFESTEKALAAKLGISFASISAKISQQSHQNLTISNETIIENEDTIVAPKCGKQSIEIYQLVTKWHFREKARKRWWKKEVNEYIHECEIPGVEYYPQINVSDKIPECGEDCIPTITYNDGARLEFRGGSINLPATVSEGKVILYGLDEKLSKGDSIMIERIPVQFPKILGLGMEEQAKIVAFEHLPTGQRLKFPADLIIGVSTSPKSVPRTFDEWWNTVPENLKQRAKSTPDYQKRLALFNVINDVLYELNFNPKGVDPPSRPELQNWLQELGT